jgi:acetylserotonin N-methyltransferase
MVEIEPERMDPPSVEDRPIWDLWLSQYRLPVVLAADQLGLFELLRDRPASIDDICHNLKLLRRSADALTAALASTGFLVQYDHQFQLTPLSRTYLLPDSEYYWVPMLGAAGFGQMTTEALLTNLRTEHLGHDDRISRRWERGEMTAEEAAASNQRMHSHSFPSALGLARSHDFAETSRLLDVAGGSGGYAIALALKHPHLRCTVADLPPVAKNARTYIERYGCQGQVDTLPFNMFDDDWPSGYDAVLMTNILHDWDPKRRADLVASSYAALPVGGHLFIHEILLNSAQDGPEPAAMFSTMMLGTRGKQLSFIELDSLLTEQGFSSIAVKPTYGYYSLVIGAKEG